VLQWQNLKASLSYLLKLHPSRPKRGSRSGSPGAKWFMISSQRHSTHLGVTQGTKRLLGGGPGHTDAHTGKEKGAGGTPEAAQTTE